MRRLLLLICWTFTAALTALEFHQWLDQVFEHRLDIRNYVRKHVPKSAIKYLTIDQVHQIDYIVASLLQRYDKDLNITEDLNTTEDALSSTTALSSQALVELYKDGREYIVHVPISPEDEGLVRLVRM